MDSVAFRGNPGDLERFAVNVLKQGGKLEELSPFEHRLSWQTRAGSGYGSTTQLRSGLKLAAAKLCWDEPWSFRIHEEETPLKFMLCQGTGPNMSPSDGASYVLGGGTLQVRRSTQAVTTTCEFVRGGADFEQLALEIEPQQLRELYGAPVLPAALEKLFASTLPYERHEQPLRPVLLRLLDEILHADARGASRQLFLEAKGLEILAALLDEMALASEALSPLGTRDVERLERARRLLVERMTSPPSLPELARAVGLNEFKLKAGFRAVFGTSVYGYLRTHRMEQAWRLLVERDSSVTEIAVQVGYANPSKFAQAFRRHFGRPPSAVR